MVDEMNFQRKREHRRKGRKWVRKWIARRQNLCASDTLLTVLSKEDSTSTLCSFFIVLNIKNVHKCNTCYWKLAQGKVRRQLKYWGA